MLTPLPEADGQVKNRPAVVLRTMPPHGDLLVCGVSTQLRHEVVGFDEIVNEKDADFTASGLKAASLIRLGFLAVLPVSSLLGSIGVIDCSFSALPFTQITRIHISLKASADYAD